MKVQLLEEVDDVLIRLEVVELEVRPCVDDTVRAGDAQYVVRSVALLHDPEVYEPDRLEHHILAVVVPSGLRDVAALSAFLAAT